MTLVIKTSLKMGDLETAAAEGGRDGLDKAAEHVMEVARNKAPLLTGAGPLHKANQERRADPGALRRSAYAKVVDDTTAEVGFTEFYAGWQHERLDYHHEGGQAKFLEEPLTSEADEAFQLMADEIARRLRS